tara:strand:+ start:608 stop:994 length:387 start_codon:yes stop_codon:yes gene_type:complete
LIQNTVSSINLFLDINGKSKISCQLKRHLSPKTVGLITRSTPLQGNAHRNSESSVYMETAIDSGIERKRTDFKMGDIAFFPIEGSIFFYIKDVYGGKPMTPIGRILSDIEKLKQIKPGDLLSLYSEIG